MPVRALMPRYTIIEPGPVIETDEPIEVSRLAALEWVDVEFKSDQPTLVELSAVLDPLFAGFVNRERGVHHGWDRVAVNGFRGAADMFVGDESADGRHPVNQLATLIYWTASLMHEVVATRCLKPEEQNDEAIRKLALVEAADRLTVAPAHRWAPQIYGRAVLFDDRVWF